MIPKIIHYCWFGGNPLPDLAMKCIDSWKKYFPDYEIKEWNETNFNLDCCDYVKEAYDCKKWAFVSDYARFWILYNYGGLYFDTDVEVIKSFDDILSSGGFMGQEVHIAPDENITKKTYSKKTLNEINNLSSGIAVAPGLGIAVAPGLKLYKEILELYNTLHFIKNGEIDETTVCVYTTNILKKYGYDEKKEEIQCVAGITVYPPEYLCPLNYKSGEIILTDNTHTIHWYGASWKSSFDIKMSEKRRVYINKYGQKKGIIYFKMVIIPDKIRRVITERGIPGAFWFIIKKIKNLI